LANLGLVDPAAAEIQAIAALAMTAPDIANFPVSLDAAIIAAEMTRLETEEAAQ
jgi:hypothetical protein